MFFAQGNCRNGDSCAFEHSNDDYTGSAAASFAHNKPKFNPADDAECQICLEKVLESGK